MNLVTLHDPWFGSYYRIEGMNPFYNLGWNMNMPISIVLGPLCSRTIRLEDISCHGPRHSDGTFIEKSVTHNYVRGSIIGGDQLTPVNVIPDPWGDGYQFTGSIVINMLVSDGSYTLRQSFRHDNSGIRELDYQIDVNLVEHEHHAVMGVQGLLKLTCKSPEGWFADEEFEQTFSFVLRLPATSDPLTRNVVYGTPELSNSVPPEGEWYWSPYGYTVPGPTPVGSDLGGTLPMAKAFAKKVLADMGDIRYDKTARDEAIYDAIENIQLGSINPLQNVFGSLIEPMQAIKQLVDLFKNITDPRTWLGKWASVLLFYKYVVRTGMLDFSSVRKIMRFLQGKRGLQLGQLKAMKLIGRGESNQHFAVLGDEVIDRYGVKICYQADVSSLDELNKLLHMLRLTPRLIDLWDLVPYSFVFDWLIPVGDAIQHMEDMSDHQNMPFQYMVVSRKTTRKVKRDFEQGGRKYRLDLIIVSYDRMVRSTFPEDVWLGVRFRDPRKHALTAGALLVQYAKK